MAQNGGIQLIDAFKYSGKRFLDLRQHSATLEELVGTPETSIPDGFTKFCEETQCWYEWNSHNDPDPETGKWRKSVPVNEMWSEEYIFAITDKQDTLLFGIREDGEVVFDKGVPGEVQQRFDELKGYQIMHDENYIFALTDNVGNLLFGIETTGHAVAPKGIVEIVSWEQYTSIKPHENTLYVIQGKGGRIDGAYINGRALSAGEEYAFMRDENLLIYHGKMTSLPRLWMDEETMELMIEYPSDYTGPLFIVDDGILFII